MAEAANLTVSITGDASGLISSLQSAEAAVAQLSSSAGALMSEFDGKEAKISITAVDNTAAGVASAKANIDSVKDKTVTITVSYVTIGKPEFARGTKSAPEGLAVVNDEKGISDPRELIEHKGRLMMFSGRDVVVPLSKGDRVYTADETKAIMSGLGLPHYASGKNNTPYKAAKADFTHYKKTHDVSLTEELSAWNDMLEKFVYDSGAVLEIEEQIFAVESKISKERKKEAENALSEYKRTSDSWIKYQVQVNGMGVDEQIEAYNRQLYNYNAMVSEMAASTLYTADEMKEIWNDFYEYKADVDLKVGKLENEQMRNEQEQKSDIYKRWQSDAKNWKKIRDTYDDWEETGDSPVSFYERSIDRIKEMYDDKNIGWQEYHDDTMEAILNLHNAKMDEVEKLLASQKQYIADTKTRFSDEENALKESWTVSDRRKNKSEIQTQLDVFKGAVTQRGIDKYKSLQEEMKKIKREEEMYALQKKHSATLLSLSEEYEAAESNKKYLLGVIERSGLNLEGIVSGARYDIASMQNTISSLFSQTIRAIKSIRVSGSSYSDNRNIKITASGSDFSSLYNRVTGSIAYGNFY